MSELEGIRLKDISLKIGSGATPRGGSNSYKTSGLALIRSQNILDLSFSYDGLAFIDSLQAEKLDNVIVEENDLLINITGDSVARICKVPKKLVSARVNQHVSIIRANPKKADQNYILYYLQAMKPYLLSISEIGGTRRALTKGMLEDLVITCPPLPEQKAIAGVLSSLDDKIDLLNRQNQTLEAMAETLFRQWFIEEAEDDWEHFQVKDFVQHIKISVKPQEKQQVLFNHFSIPSFDNDKTPQVEYGKAIQSNKYKVFENTILVSKLNPMTPRVWAIINLHSSNSICSTEFQVIQPLDQKLLGFFFYLLKSNRVVTELGMAASGTSGSHQRITALDILHISFSVPNMARINSFSQLVRGNLLKIDKNRESIKALERFRDLLLPKLMSGEVRVEF